MKVFDKNEIEEVKCVIIEGEQEEVKVGKGYDSKDLYDLYKLGIKHNVRVCQCTQYLHILHSVNEITNLEESLDVDKEYIVIPKIELTKEQKDAICNIKCVLTVMDKSAN